MLEQIYVIFDRPFHPSTALLEAEDDMAYHNHEIVKDGDGGK